MKVSIIDEFKVAESTKNTYRSVFNRLEDILRKTKLTEVKKVQKIISKNVPLSTSINYYKFISKYLQHIKEDKEIIEQYRKILFDINKKIKEKQPEKLKKLKEGKYKDIKYQESINNFIKRIRKNNHETDLLEFILSFYILLPPRRTDYHDMIYVDNISKINDKDNFLVGDKLFKDRYGLIFNNFKNKKSSGTLRLQITDKADKDLVKIIYRKNFKDGDLIYPKSKRQYFRDIKKITKRVFNKELGINDLRKLHSSHEFSKTKKEIERMKQDAKMMSHSVKTKLENYII